jgi:small subunit ribosomal protein S16
MLVIRLQRTGKKNHANFRVVIAEKSDHVSKKFKEILGNYDPHSKELNIRNTERLQYWIEQHVHLSATVHNLLVEKGLIKGEKVHAFTIPKKEVVAEAAPAATPAPAAEEKTEEVAEAPAEEAAPEAAPTEAPAENA